MKVILLENVKGQGKKGDIINVKDGYGMFLVKDKKAVNATDGSINRLNKENEAKAREEELLIKEMQSLKVKLESNKYSFKVKTGEHDRVFGSISTKQIASELKNKGFDIDKKQIHLDHELSALGTHNVDIILHKKVTATIKIDLIKEK